MSIRYVITPFLALILLLPVAKAFEALPDQPPIPTDNPMSEAKIELGKQLFFDPRLSLDGTISCNSCHNVMSGGTDNRSVSVGINGQKTDRSAPTVWNAAFLSTLFWDGRAATLEEQVKEQIINPVEMGMPNEKAVLDRLSKIPGYVAQFNKVFGGVSALTFDNLAKAIAAYERTLITPNSSFDRYIKGEKTALSKKAIRGLKLIREIGCTACHSGINFSGPPLPEGQGFFQKFPIYTNSRYEVSYKLSDDTGRHNVSNNGADRNMWRVPSLRNIALTAPYFHNGSVKTLEEAIRVMAKTQQDKRLNNRQVDDIASFLNSLTGEFPEQTMPRLPEYKNASLVVTRH